MSYPDIIVSGAGASAFNGTYYDTGNLSNGRPIYADGANHQIKCLFNYWVIAQIAPPSYAYRSGMSDVPDTPDLAAAWFVQNSPGTDPAPTVTAASSSQNLTLTCAAGSYSLTGTNVTLTHTPASQNLTLACNAGTYSLTGTNVDLTSSRTIVCEPASGGAYPDIIVSGAGTSDANGTYEYAGETFGKPYYTKGSESISWFGLGYDVWAIFVDGLSVYESTDDVATPDLVTTWTAVNTGIAPVPTVTAAPSLGYVLTGSDVTLTYTQGAQSYTLACEAGSYTLTGTDTTFEVKRNYVLDCEAGSYTLTGTDCTLTAQFHYSLVCEAGSYTYTGTDISFGNTTAYTLVCEAGSYSLTGSDISFAVQHNYTFVCEAGSYSLTGTDSDLVLLRNYILACSAGTYSLTGTNAALTSARTMALEAGSYTLTGTNADLYRALVMACEAGTYALTGTGVDFVKALIMALGEGSYALTGTGAGLNVYYAWVTTPACRALVIVAENRVYAIPAENRTFTIKCCGG